MGHVNVEGFLISVGFPPDRGLFLLMREELAATVCELVLLRRYWCGCCCPEVVIAALSAGTGIAERVLL